MKELYNDFSQSSFNLMIINELINKSHDVTIKVTGVTFQGNQTITLKSSDEEWKYIHIFLEYERHKAPHCNSSNDIRGLPYFM